MKKYIRITFSFFGGLFLVWLLFHDTDWKSVYITIKQVKVGWLVLAQIFTWSSYFSRVQRWSYIVRITHPVTYRMMFSATSIGFLVNFTAPARLGEIVRAYVLARLSKLDLFQCIAMVTLDRFTDLLSLLVVILIALFSFPTMNNIEIATGVLNNTESFIMSKALIQKTATSLMLLVCFILIVIICMYLNHNLILKIINTLVNPISKRLTNWFTRVLTNLTKGMHILRSKMQIVKSICFSLLTWALIVLSMSAALNAFGFKFPWFTPFLLSAMIAIFISVPIVPGVIGQFHIPIIACLLIAIPEVKLVEIKAFAILTHILGLIPIAVLGIFSLFLEKLKLLNFTLD